MPESVDVAITIGDETRIGRLTGNATAADLATQLPITIRMNDFNGVEKVGRLPRPLATVDVPSGAAPEVDDIGYYGPSVGLVFYYGHVGYWPGIVRIGRLEPEVTAWIRDQPDGFHVTIGRR